MPIAFVLLLFVSANGHMLHHALADCAHDACAAHDSSCEARHASCLETGCDGHAKTAADHDCRECVFCATTEGRQAPVVPPAGGSPEITPATGTPRSLAAAPALELRRLGTSRDPVFSHPAALHAVTLPLLD